MSNSIVRKAILKAGGPRAVAIQCGKSTQAVMKWMDRGLPRTEWTGETDYSSVIERLAKDPQFSKSRLLDSCRFKRREIEARA